MSQLTLLTVIACSIQNRWRKWTSSVSPASGPFLSSLSGRVLCDCSAHKSPERWKSDSWLRECMPGFCLLHCKNQDPAWVHLGSFKNYCYACPWRWQGENKEFKRLNPFSISTSGSVGSSLKCFPSSGSALRGAEVSALSHLKSVSSLAELILALAMELSRLQDSPRKRKLICVPSRNSSPCFQQYGTASNSSVIHCLKKKIYSIFHCHEHHLLKLFFEQWINPPNLKVIPPVKEEEELYLRFWGGTWYSWNSWVLPGSAEQSLCHRALESGTFVCLTWHMDVLQYITFLPWSEKVTHLNCVPTRSRCKVEGSPHP